MDRCAKVVLLATETSKEIRVLLCQPSGHESYDIEALFVEWLERTSFVFNEIYPVLWLHFRGCRQLVQKVWEKQNGRRHLQR